MKRKIKAFWVSMISLAVLLTGIGGVSAPVAAQEKIVLRITDWQAGVQNILDSYREFIKIFEEKHPNVKVEYTQYSYTTYGEFLKPSLAAGTAPDIFAVYPGGELAKLVPSGSLVAISDIWDEEWKSWLGKAASFNGALVDGKLWVAPQDAQTECVWIHKDMLEAAGMEVPALGQGATVDELIDIVEPAKQLGYDVILAGFLDYYSVCGAYYNMAHQLQKTDTPDLVMKALNGEISWQQDIFRLPMEAFKKMHEAHVWREDAINMDYQVQAWGKWLNREGIGIWCNGDWFAGSCPPEENNPDNPNIGTFMYPLVNKDATPAYNWGFGTDLGIYSKGKHQDLCREFIRFTNSPEGAKIFVKHYVNPAAAGALDIRTLPGTDNPVFDECIELFSSVEGRASEYFYTQAEVQDALFTGTVSVMIGQQTIDDVLANLDEVSGYKR